MDLLLTQLEELFNQQDNYHINEDDGWAYFNDSELYDEVVGLCCDVLITSNGQCNWNNIWILRNKGYHVFPGDRDSFGWLVGCIQKVDDELMRTVCYG